MPSNKEARRERSFCLSTSQGQPREPLQQPHQDGQAHQQPATTLYFHQGEGSGSVFRFRIGPDYYWIEGSGPGGSLTPSEEEQFYRAMENAGVERVEDEIIWAEEGDAV
ncbi:hypothetical protein V8C35DRAFT_312216 [Trichoderma chlorosporum]